MPERQLTSRPTRVPGKIVLAVILAMVLVIAGTEIAVALLRR